MASCITAYWGSNTTPRVRLTVTQSASTDTSVTLSWVFEYIAKYAVSTSIKHGCTAVINGTTVHNAGYAINGKTGTNTIASGTINVPKGTAAKNVAFSCSMDFSGITWSSKYSGKNMTASGSISVAAKTYYTVAYNANGGSGAPSSQTKWHGTALALSNTKPTRTGYSFQGWATSASGGVAYAAGASYTANANVTLYAVWKANTYTVTYNANGGSGVPSNQTKTYGVTLTLSSTKPTRTNYIFKGWGTSASATTVTYAPGASYTKNAKITLYAIWELAYVKPRIFNVSVTRCDSEGTANEEGTYALVSFDWETDLEAENYKITWSLSDTVSGVQMASLNGTSDTVSVVVGKGALSAETTYDIDITVSDGTDSSHIVGILPSTKFVIDFRAGGTGVAFGKAAELDNTAEFAFDAKFNEPVYGKALGMDRLPAIPENSDLNDYMEPGCYAVHSNAIAATCSNIPVDRAGRLEVWSSTGEGIRSEQWSYLRQRYVPYNDANAVWERDVARGSDNVWHYYDWWRSTLTPNASAKVYHDQKVLWGADMDTGMYMTAGHTATLSEKISEQAEGIELVFCYYNGTDDTNWAWQSFRVSKKLVALEPGGAHSFRLANGKFGSVGTKYLYINDDSIVGHADNNLTGTAGSGITYANNKFVLRYVLGV